MDPIVVVGLAGVAFSLFSAFCAIKAMIGIRQAREMMHRLDDAKIYFDSLTLDEKVLLTRRMDALKSQGCRFPFTIAVEQYQAKESQ